MLKIINSCHKVYIEKLSHFIAHFFYENTINNKSSFDKHLQKILKLLNMTADELMLYHSAPTKPVTAVYSWNAPKNYEMSDVAKKQYGLLLDVVDLCAIYY